MQHQEKLRTPLISFAITAAVALAGVAALRADSGLPDKAVPVTVTVTATSHDRAAAEVSQNEVVVRQDGDVRPIVSWKPAERADSRLELAIMIDDQASRKISSNLDELRQFVRGQSPNTKIAITYANYGTAETAQPFTTDHDRAAKAIRMPSAIRGTSNGTYDSIREFVKHWPDDGNRRVMLLISSGIDLTDGIVDTNPYQNIPLDNAIQAAQRANVGVFTIFASGDTRALRNPYLTNNGQGSLERLASETGGHAFFQGLSTPISLQPFLKQLNEMLGRQYVLTILAEADTKGEYSRLKLTAEQSGVELHAPKHIRVPRER